MHSGDSRQRDVDSDSDDENVAAAPSDFSEGVAAAIWGDATPDDRLRFFRLVFRFAVAFHIAWACGFLQPIGLTGFAWTSDIDSAIAKTEKEHPGSFEIRCIDVRLTHHAPCYQQRSLQHSPR